MVREPYGCWHTRRPDEALAAGNAANFINGNLINLFQNIDIPLLLAGRQPFNNLQAIELFMRSSLGRSNYNGFLTTVRKRFASGLAFDANYTFSRSEDQVGRYRTTPASCRTTSIRTPTTDRHSTTSPTSSTATGCMSCRSTGTVCGEDGIRPASSGRRAQPPPFPSFRAHRSGWQSEFRCGILAPFRPAISRTPVSTGASRDPAGSAPAASTNPTGLNIFRDPQAVYGSVRRLSLSSDTRSGRGVFRGLGFWQLDLSLGKSTRIAGDVRLTVSVDAINALNKVNFADPVTTSISLQNTANFGVITTQRVIALQNIFRGGCRSAPGSISKLKMAAGASSAGRLFQLSALSCQLSAASLQPVDRTDPFMRSA